ncbi:MAG: hypothetical protein M5R36_03795 [Deltaproteobacteria bacterium]|nr:hypothetical protein [Deltaproteobacteria bacterium]
MAVLTLLAAMTACGEREEGSPPHPNYDTLMDAGKRALEDGDGAGALKYFNLAEEVRPGDSAANLGEGIAAFLQVVTFVDEGIVFAGKLASTAEPDAAEHRPEGTVASFQTMDGEPGSGAFIDLFFSAKCLTRRPTNGLRT